METNTFPFSYLIVICYLLPSLLLPLMMMQSGTVDKIRHQSAR